MAVRLRKLASEEAERVFPRPGQQDVSEYVAALRDVQPGEAAGIEREGSSDRAIKRRLGLAAKQLGYRLKWARQSGPKRLYFQVIGTPRVRATNGRRRRRARIGARTTPTSRIGAAASWAHLEAVPKDENSRRQHAWTDGGSGSQTGALRE